MHLFQDVLNAKRLVTKEMSWSQQHEHRKQLIFQWRLPKKELKNILFRGRSGTLAKSREGQQLLAGGVTEDQRHPAHNPRSLPVCVLAGHSLSAAVDIIPGRRWHHARAEKL